MSAVNTNMPTYSLQDGENVLASTVHYLSASSIAQYLQKSPTIRATLTMGSDTVNLPIYALRRRNAIK
ncbi:unnamed protein product [Cunninghamella blakesleeana]